MKRKENIPYSFKKKQNWTKIITYFYIDLQINITENRDLFLNINTTIQNTAWN